jgi:polyferredoxin
MATRTSARTLPVLPSTPSPRVDLTRAPALGRFLRWKHARTAVQVPLLLLAAIIVADGFFGPRAGPENAAGVGPWIQWRGFVVLALLLVGNLFCMACPFMLPRRLAKKLLPADRT